MGGGTNKITTERTQVPATQSPVIQATPRTILQWDPTDFIECLEVLPEVEEHETSYIYRINKNNKSLLLTVWPLESVIGITLYTGDFAEEIFTFYAVVTQPAIYKKEKNSEYLILRQTAISPGPFYFNHLERDPFDPEFKAWIDIKIQVTPEIQVKLQP